MMNPTAFMSSQACRIAEEKMRYCAASGGIKEGRRLLVSVEKCLFAALKFYKFRTFHKGGHFLEIIATDEFSLDEIKGIMQNV
jgi:hypothetical protein